MPTIVSRLDNTKMSDNRRIDKTGGRTLRISRCFGRQNPSQSLQPPIADILVNNPIKQKTYLLIISILINKINKYIYILWYSMD